MTEEDVFQQVHDLVQKQIAWYLQFTDLESDDLRDIITLWYRRLLKDPQVRCTKVQRDFRNTSVYWYTISA